MSDQNQQQVVFRCEGLQKRYGRRCVVQLERLDIRGGEILAILGPSGAGKSTLLKLLSFLEYPSAGKMYYTGRSMIAADVPLQIRREVTLVMQASQLLKRSVAANIEYGLRLRGISPRDPAVSHYVERVVQRLGLSELLEQPADTLSGGEKQRVALARALVLKPRVLLLDEPTSNLDPYHIQLIESMVAESHIAEGMTIVIVTHNIFQAKRLADRVALMIDGKLIEIGEKTPFFERPQHPDTARFLAGEMLY